MSELRRSALVLSSRQGRAGFIAALVACICVSLALILTLTAWPVALLIRNQLAAAAAQSTREMQPYVPNTPLTGHLGVPYGRSGENGTLDAFTPASGTDALATVVWIHGGEWISGSATDVDPYLRILAAQGYTTIGLNYRVAPEAIYPHAVEQLNDALAFIEEHADGLHVDRNQIILAGDGTGAQLASQLALLTNNPRYAHLLGIFPSLMTDQLVGMILDGGIYDVNALSLSRGPSDWSLRIALWAYTGTKDWSQTDAGLTMSSIDFVTKDFPPTFITGGNGDPLTWTQSVPMSNALQAAGVDTTEVFWPANHTPQLPAGFQFKLDYPDAYAALADTLLFLGSHTYGYG